MVREPGISARRMAVLLNYDKTFVAKLKRKIDGELKRSIENSLVVEDLKELENIYRSLSLDMYSIIEGGKKDSDKVKAFDSLMDGKKMLIQQKMDAGIFKRKLGEMEIIGNKIEFVSFDKPENKDASKDK